MAELFTILSVLSFFLVQIIENMYYLSCGDHRGGRQWHVYHHVYHHDGQQCELLCVFHHDGQHHGALKFLFIIIVTIFALTITHFSKNFSSKMKY